MLLFVSQIYLIKQNIIKIHNGLTLIINKLLNVDYDIWNIFVWFKKYLNFNTVKSW